MAEDIATSAPTSSAATSQTEPEVVAGISSAEGSPDMPLAIRVGAVEFAVWRTLFLLGGGIALGYAAMRLLGGRSGAGVSDTASGKSAWF